MKKVITVLFIIAAATSIKAQQVNLDSLFNYYLNEENPDTLRGNALMSIAWEHRDLDSSIYYYQKLLEFGTELNSKYFQGHGYNGLGFRKGQAGDLISCKTNLEKAIALFREIKYRRGEAGAFINLGSNYMERGHTAKSISNLKQGVEICEKEKIYDFLAIAYGSLCGVYYNIKDYDRALEYNILERELNAKVGNDENFNISIGNLAMLYREKEAYSKAIRAAKKSLVYWSEQNLQDWMANTNIELGKTYLEMNTYDSAKFHLTKSIELLESQKNEYPKLLGDAYAVLGELYLKLNEYSKAITLCQQSAQLAQEVNSYIIEEQACNCLYNAHKANNNGIEALKYYELKTALGDSLKKDEDVKKLQQMEFEKQLIRDSLAKVEMQRIENAKMDELKEQKQRKNRIQYSLVVIVVLLLATLIAVATKFSISPRLASGLIFIFFILLFEFLLVVLDPWVDSVSNGEVGWKIAINTAIALVLFGVHQVSEKKLKKWILKVDNF